MDKLGMSSADWSNYHATSAKKKVEELEYQIKVIAKKLGIEDIVGETERLKDEERKLEQERRAAEIAAAEAEAKDWGITFNEYLRRKMVDSTFKRCLVR